MEAQQKPPNSLPLTRFLIVVQQSESSKVLEEITIEIFKNVFAQGSTSLFTSNPSDAINNLVSALGNTLSKDKIKEYVEKSNDKEMKEYAKNEAKKYVEEWNAYGVPWMKFKRGRDGQIKHFMGSDRFEMITDW